MKPSTSVIIHVWFFIVFPTVLGAKRLQSLFIFNIFYSRIIL